MGPKPFRFLNAWFTYPDFKSFCSEKWSGYEVSGRGGYVLKEKIKLLKEDLKVWNKEIFGNIGNSIEKYRQELKILDTIDDVLGLEDMEIVRRNEIKALLFLEMKKKGSMVQQKSRSKWILEGDENTSFFHNCINRRRKANEFTGLLVEGVWIEEALAVKGEVNKFFKDHFKRVHWVRPLLAADFTEKQISTDNNEMLIAGFTEEEVREAIWECDGSKCPGPDGLNFKFWKNFWEVIKVDLMRFVGEFQEHGRINRGLNPSFITLIPKKEDAASLLDYRPISLIGSVYKIIAKLLSRRLSRVLDSIISEQQSAFVGGSNILDSVVVLNETIDEVKRMRSKAIFFKIDFAKAYDSIDWVFLEVIMRRFNFHTKWIAWIMECVKTASAAVLVNGSPTEEFSLGRGLRQGDPLSPFLFLIVAESISIMMGKAIRQGLFEEVKVGRDMVGISHLQFADDTIFMGKATRENVWFLKIFLKIIEFSSGLRVNNKKCCLYGVNVDEGSIREYADILGCQVGRISFVYLGVKVGTAHIKISEWGQVVQKVKNRVLKWENLKISFGGRHTLLNAILLSLPVYFLSTYRAPKKVLSEIKKIQRRFFGGEGGGE